MTRTAVEQTGRNGGGTPLGPNQNERWRFDMADACTKVCSACGQELPVADFHKNARMSDGIRSSCKVCVLRINRASVLRHHEKRKAEKREAYRNIRHTPEYLEYVKHRQLVTRDQKRAYDAERHRINRSAIVDRVKQWTNANPDKRSTIIRNYSARRRSQTENGVTTKELHDWTKAQKKLCYWCGDRCEKAFHVDHYHPLSKGGAHELSNLVIACPACNVRKHAKDPLEFAKQVGRLF